MGVAQQIHHTLPPHLESASKSGEQNRLKKALLGGLLAIQPHAESGSDLMGCPVVGRDRCNMRTSLAIGIADVDFKRAAMSVANALSDSPWWRQREANPHSICVQRTPRRRIVVSCEITDLNRREATVITRRVFLELLDDNVPEASHEIEARGFTVLRAALGAEEIASLRADVERVYREIPADRRNKKLPPEERESFRYEMLNRSEPCRKLVADRRLLDVVEPLLGEDCHVIANTAWRNAASRERFHGGGNWHVDAGPHVPRPAGVPWDNRIPYPVFAIGVHVMLDDCPVECGPTGFIPGSHRSGQHPPFDRVNDDDLTCDGIGVVPVAANAGDVVLFSSDVWHRRMPSGDGDTGRFFVQIHYGRRDIAQRLRTTAEVNHLSDEAISSTTDGRDRTTLGLHDPFFYDG
jgi:ectoine hydroxylase-related dioxygenase (phytanoyl-CoA dioxygenase family)